MSLDLGYSYTVKLTELETEKINEPVETARYEFSRGVITGASLSMAAGIVYMLSTGPAHADKVPGKQPPAPAPKGTEVAKPNKAKPKPFSPDVKDALTGGIGSICVAAANSGDFYLGLACSLLLVFGAILVNRRNPD